MKINKSSWHYKLNEKLKTSFTDIPTTKGEYIVLTINNVFLQILIYVFLISACVSPYILGIASIHDYHLKVYTSNAIVYYISVYIIGAITFIVYLFILIGLKFLVEYIKDKITKSKDESIEYE